jgi:hypothetical protein
MIRNHNQLKRQTVGIRNSTAEVVDLHLRAGRVAA